MRTIDEPSCRLPRIVDLVPDCLTYQRALDRRQLACRQAILEPLCGLRLEFRLIPKGLDEAVDRAQ